MMKHLKELSTLAVGPHFRAQCRCHAELLLDELDGNTKAREALKRILSYGNSHGANEYIKAIDDVRNAVIDGAMA